MAEEAKIPVLALLIVIYTLGGSFKELMYFRFFVFMLYNIPIP